MECEVVGLDRAGDDVADDVVVVDEDKLGVVGHEWNGVVLTLVGVGYCGCGGGGGCSGAAVWGACDERDISKAARETDFSQIARECRSRWSRVSIQLKILSRKPIVQENLFFFFLFFFYFFVGGLWWWLW